MMLKNQRLRSGTKEVGTHLYTRLLILQEAYSYTEQNKKKRVSNRKRLVFIGVQYKIKIKFFIFIFMHIKKDFKYLVWS